MSRAVHMRGRRWPWTIRQELPYVLLAAADLHLVVRRRIGNVLLCAGGRTGFGPGLGTEVLAVPGTG